MLRCLLESVGRRRSANKTCRHVFSCDFPAHRRSTLLRYVSKDRMFCDTTTGYHVWYVCRPLVGRPKRFTFNDCSVTGLRSSLEGYPIEILALSTTAVFDLLPRQQQRNPTALMVSCQQLADQQSRHKTWMHMYRNSQ